MADPSKATGFRKKAKRLSATFTGIVLRRSPSPSPNRSSPGATAGSSNDRSGPDSSSSQPLDPLSLPGLGRVDLQRTPPAEMQEGGPAPNRRDIVLYHNCLMSISSERPPADQANDNETLNPTLRSLAMSDGDGSDEGESLGRATFNCDGDTLNSEPASEPRMDRRNSAAVESQNEPAR